MVDISVMHNGATNLPLKEVEDDDGRTHIIPDASIREMHEDCKEVIRDQIEHGVLAEKAGYDRVTWTEHHFQITGAEFSPAPILTGMAVAAQTDEIKIGQWANIATWHDPIRLSEQIAMLDIVSDGRVEAGLGRGYQPREAEVLGEQYFGGTIQDQEKNRQVYNESVDIILEAWTKDMMSYNGHYHHVPPKHTKWHHLQEKMYLEDDVTEYDVENMMDWKEGDLYSKGDSWSAITAGGTTLKSLSVFPQPLQKPYPQLWVPATSYRSIRVAAERGINAISFGDPSVDKKMQMYMEAAEEAGWPDHRPEYDGQPFAYGYDEERNRGIAIGRWIFNVDLADDETYERWKQGLEHGWNYFGPFGFQRAFVDDPSERATAEMLLDERVAIAGDTDFIINAIAEMKEEAGTEDLSLCCFFETAGLSGEEANNQLEGMAEKVFPYLREQFPSPEQR